MRLSAVLLSAALLAAPLGAFAAAGLRGDAPRAAPSMREDARRLRAEILELEAELVRLGRAQHADEDDAAGGRAALARLNAGQVALEAEIGANRVRLTRLLGALQLYEKDPPPPLFVHAGSARDAARAAVLMKTIAPEMNARGEALAGQADRIRRTRREATMASEALLLTESELEERRADIERLLARKSGLERSLLADADAADRRARALADRAGSLGELVGDLSQTGRGLAGAQPMRPVVLAQPVRGDLVRRFGERSGAGRASGLSWRTAGAAQVLSPVDARVEYVGPLKGYGLVVILTPSPQYHVVLAGLDQAASGAGRTVRAGEPIGRMAADGGLGGVPELYLELRREGRPVDPARWLAARPSGERRS
jgi:septal ring factor EnvC (AmiA/AmiB activator)